MRVRTLVIYITTGFVAAVLALVAVQYMTRRNLEELISANESLLDEYRMSSGLSHQADSTSRAALAVKINLVDQSGQRVLRWNLYLTIGVLALLTAVFAIIIGRMKKQAELIGQLNTSERKLKEAVLVKENFLANMSHEIRTPLNAILGYTNLLQKKKLDADTRLHITTVQQSGETLLAIVNDILDLSKIESGMMRIEHVPFDPEALVHSVGTMFHHRSAEKNVPLIVSFDPAIPETITGDPTRLTQILVNLVSNAFKFTETGEINLRVTANGRNDDRVNLMFEVTDTGIGIETERLETIFERFRQAEDSTTRQFGGTGLGLSIVRDLVHLQDGHIALSSKPGAGTSVKVTIPYRVAVESELPLAGAPAEAAHAQRPGLRVLIAEDHIINQGLMMRLMEERGIAGRVATNGFEAIEMLRSEPFDLVFMDIQMPGMDGYTATRAIREELKLTIPVIAMTAHAMEGEKEKCIRLGMDDHMAKPVRESELDRVLTTYTKPLLRNGVSVNPFKVIDLDYMREISNGDASYEKLVTEQFLHLMPRELEALSAAVGKRDRSEIRRIAHGIKTTISIMGLNALLDEPLDVLENGSSAKEDISGLVEQVLGVCKEALGEAGIFYRQFQRD
ncbi:signal transduction histidine kinase/CheY-like chemotaxis protein [Dyadobacter sp. BE34]|uniref:histidine kinase n=1 Tax=Dyadobacter fermentans TaxID=94254 RepID=A0ABU1QWL3_9BACT|nr:MULTISPECIES: ATP-binding protein [Dyadobacter]MDR6805382.1 signal transduction histidine kinase/CheY-like chemotaxis protein [Dyadobacter fermentans]MDR7042858.1 signal transduction histidine kinase/CheY-like chemotaxis protein [Dyadobacter sp. BE242]MDR7197170.1 signal transduction histidine kinase/CheY-like chemotaxis protein [Dyadobacter sp. BE34]MDR7215395.1 signal transduction histidine kinase/CheY-like chemotaxis protein [Dyadobacter sp. BE31]MDR7262931.1 signal transduction histidin